MSAESKAARMEILDKEIEELVNAGQEGSKEPTQSTEEVESESSEEATKVTTGQAEVETETKAEEDTLEHWKDRALVAERRYNTSKPKYDSNIYKLRQENIQLQKSRIELQKSLNEARQALLNDKPDNLDELFDEQTIDVLGEKTADAIKQSVRDTNARVTAQEKKAADAKIAADEAKVRAQVNTEFANFISALERIVPDQAKLNVDEGFLTYLEGVDEMTGTIRQTILTNAANARDVGRCAQFFNDYKKTLAPKKVEVKDSVNKRIAPSQDGSTSVQDISDSGKISIEFVDKFYNDVTKGLFKGRHNEQMKIEAQIDQAFISGNLI